MGNNEKTHSPSLAVQWKVFYSESRTLPLMAYVLYVTELECQGKERKSIGESGHETSKVNCPEACLRGLTSAKDQSLGP